VSKDQIDTYVKMILMWWPMEVATEPGVRRRGRSWEWSGILWDSSRQAGGGGACALRAVCLLLAAMALSNI